MPLLHLSVCTPDKFLIQVNHCISGIQRMIFYYTGELCECYVSQAPFTQKCFDVVMFFSNESRVCFLCVYMEMFLCFHSNDEGATLERSRC